MSTKKTTPKAPPATRGAAPGEPGWYPRVGDIWPGQGIYAGIVRGAPSQPDHHLFMSADPRTYIEKVAFGGHGHETQGAGCSFDGQANTLALVADSQPHPAAAWAALLDVEGHKDWYLPSRRELRLLWVNCAELFANGWYWSSTQYSARTAWYQYFDVGSQDGSVKDYEGRARAVRRLVIQ